MSRISLHCDTTINVNCLGGADFLNIPEAVAYCRDELDAAGYKLVIQVAPGTYPDPVELFDVPGVRPGAYNTRHLCIRGDLNNPSNVKIAMNRPGGAFNTINCKCGWVIEGFEISNPGGTGVDSHANSHVYVGKNTFLQCGMAHLMAGWGGFLEIVGDHLIAGGAQYHLAATQGSRILYSPPGITTLTGNPTFSQGFCLSEDSRVYFNSRWILGSATGYRWRAGLGGGIICGLTPNNPAYPLPNGGTNPNYLPGTQPGISYTPDWPGKYI